MATKKDLVYWICGQKTRPEVAPIGGRILRSWMPPIRLKILLTNDEKLESKSIAVTAVLDPLSPYTYRVRERKKKP